MCGRFSLGAALHAISSCREERASVRRVLGSHHGHGNRNSRNHRAPLWIPAPVHLRLLAERVDHVNEGAVLWSPRHESFSRGGSGHDSPGVVINCLSFRQDRRRLAAVYRPRSPRGESY